MPNTRSRQKRKSIKKKLKQTNASVNYNYTQTATRDPSPQGHMPPSVDRPSDIEWMAVLVAAASPLVPHFRATRRLTRSSYSHFQIDQRLSYLYEVNASVGSYPTD